MFDGKSVAVVVPCYNEETQINNVLETMPDFVDRIIVVDDCSKDATTELVKTFIASEPTREPAFNWIRPNMSASMYDRADVVMYEIRKEEDTLYPPHQIFNDNTEERTVLINHLENAGVGGAIATGYKWCRDHGIDCTAVMAGDGQMDPSELESMISPVCNEKIDYVKGNRLSHPAAKVIIPKKRHFGNTILSLLTKVSSGYWHISDTQTGYTAISYHALNNVPLHKIYRRYGCPNDILVKLNIANCTIREISIKPVYAVGEQSKMKIGKAAPRILWLLIKSFFIRLYNKYFITSFHPLFLLYIGSLLTAAINLPIFIKIFIDVILRNGSVSVGYYVTFLLLTVFTFQSLCFGMWMDIQDNEKLNR